MKSKIIIEEMLFIKQELMKSKSNFHNEQEKRDVVVQIDILKWVLKNDEN